MEKEKKTKEDYQQRKRKRSPEHDVEPKDPSNKDKEIDMRKPAEPEHKPRGSKSELYPEEENPPRKYGYWSSKPGQELRPKPKALILFSGRARAGDLHQSLVTLGWRVCSIDTVAPRPTDIIDESVWSQVEADLEEGFYDALWVATPCGTFSPLREIPPGPGVLRTVRHITGLPASQLSMAEQKQLKEGNILVSRSASSVSLAKRRKIPWGWENPIHPPDKPSLWMMPSAAAILKEKGTLCADFDQCTTGLETTKPTRVAYEHISLHEIQGCKCNHPPVEQISSKGKKYYAPHPSPAQRWRTGPDGKMERASKALGQYTARLSGILAKAFHATQQGAGWLSAELSQEALP